jgi:protein-tyrosine phosphatase
MKGYFDIHNHLLPGLDDGSHSMDETRSMLLQAYDEGIRIIVATPHYCAGRSVISVNKMREVLAEVVLTLEEETEKVQVILGNELEYNSDMLDSLRKGEALTIDDTRYILVEFKAYDTFNQIRVGLYHCLMAGYIPILAHAERYHCLVKSPNLVEELVKLGTYIQINMSGILGMRLNPKTSFCHRLLKKGLVHFLGTDAHGSIHRVVKMKNAVQCIRKKYGDNLAQRLLWDNPMIMLANNRLN